MDSVCSCASIAEQKATGTASSATDTASSNSQQTQSQTQPASVGPHPGLTQTQPASVGPHPGLSEAAFKRAVGETPPSPDDLEKVLSTGIEPVLTYSLSVD